MKRRLPPPSPAHATTLSHFAAHAHPSLAPKLLAVALALACGQGQAVPLVWTGPYNGGGFFTPYNWNFYKVPGSADTTEIYNANQVALDASGSVISVFTAPNVTFYANNGHTLTLLGTGGNSSFQGTLYLGDSSNTAGNLINQAGNLTINNLQNVTSGNTELRVDGNGNISANWAYKTGSGTFSINRTSGTGTVTVGDLRFSGGTINGSAPLTINGNTVWTGNTTMGGTGTSTANAAVTIGSSSGGSTTASLSRTFRVNSLVILYSNSSSTTTLDIKSDGVFDITGNWNVIQNNGGARNITNAGTFKKSSGSSGSVISPTFSNSGIIDSQEGILSFNSAVTGTGGTIKTTGNGAVTLNGIANTVGTLDLNGGSPGARLNLGANNITVYTDYNNRFGIGNAFNRYAGVNRTTGNISPSAGALQGVSLNGGTVTTAASAGTLAYGNVRVGSNNSQSYTVKNTSASGPSLRGAIQNGATAGGSTLDARLSGEGVISTVNYGPLGTGVFSGNLAVNFNPGTAGALSGQQVKVVSNFGAGQTIGITGTAYDYAKPMLNTASPVNLGIVHVGDAAPTGSVSISNTTVSNASYQDSLNASASTNNAKVTGNSFTALVAGSTSSLTLTGNTSSAGSLASTVTLGYVSNANGVSGLNNQVLASGSIQTIGQVNNYAVSAYGNHSGDGSFYGSGLAYTLDLGSILQGSGSASATLAALNIGGNAPYTDLIDGSFTFTGGMGMGFTLTGFTDFSDLHGGDSYGGLSVALNNATVGSFSETVTLKAVGHNASGYSGGLSDVTLTITGTVAAVPEPETYALMLAGLGLVGFVVRRRKQQAA